MLSKGNNAPSFLPVLLIQCEGFLTWGREYNSLLRLSEWERIQRCLKFCPAFSRPLCSHCDKPKLEKKKKSNGLACRYPVNSIPEADKNVLGVELMSFRKQLFLGKYCPESELMLQFMI